MGLLGNLVVLIILVRTKIKQTSIFFMCVLSVIDLVACIIVIPGIIAHTWHYKFYYDFLCKSWEFLRYFTIPTSAMVLVAIAFDRFYIICLSPHRISNTATGIIISVIMVLGIGCGVPPILGVGVYAPSDNGVLFNVEYCITSYRNITIDDLDIYWNIITAIFIGMIICIVFFYLAIFFVVLQQNRKWNKVKREQVHVVAKERDNDSRRTSQNYDHNKLYNTRASIELIKGSASRMSTAWTEISENVNLVDDVFANGEKVKKTADLDDATKGNSCMPSISKETGISKVAIISGRRNNKVAPMELQTSTSHPIESIETDKETTDRNNSESGHKSTTKGKRVMIQDKSHNKEKKPTAAAKVKVKSGVRPIHIKTTQVLFTVTLVYIVSFLPTFLMSYNIVPQQQVIYLMYFFNNAANPMIYSFMNPKFRAEVYKLLKVGCCRK